MTSSRLDSPTHTTGAHRAPRRAPRSGTRTLTQRPPARYEPYLDGLFTYCLAVLSDHDAATAVLGDVLAVSERQFGRCPTEEPERRAWLYAIARWACLRRLAERRSARQGAHAGRTGARTAPVAPAPVAPAATTDPAHHSGTPGATHPASSAAVAEERRRELALLAWPEAAGTTPEQREALELAVRHQLTARQVATVLGIEPPAARELLAAAACEVERTRAALAVVRSGACPSVSALAGDDRVLLSAALRNELVRHVDDCPRCRRAAERAGAGGPWPGSSVTPDRLPLVEAERAAAYAAMLDVPRARATGPRFRRDGFPLDPRDQAARRERLRARAVTTTVVATVVAAPVIALWAAYRSAPLTGETRGGPPVSAADNEGSETRDDESGRPERYENAASARSEHAPEGSAAEGVAVQVLQPGTPPPPARPGSPAPGRVTVAARPHSGDTTVLTLTASGGAPVEWSLWTDAPWLYADRTSGTLAPGQSVTVYISVDHEREPAGPWSGRVGVDPVGAVVGIDGHGDTDPPRPGPVRPPRPTPPVSTPPPTDPEPTTPAPTPTPTQPTTPPPSTDPTPTPTPTDPSPTPTGTTPGEPPPADG